MLLEEEEEEEASEDCFRAQLMASNRVRVRIPKPFDFFDSSGQDSAPSELDGDPADLQQMSEVERLLNSKQRFPSSPCYHDITIMLASNSPELKRVSF